MMLLKRYNFTEYHIKHTLTQRNKNQSTDSTGGSIVSGYRLGNGPE